MILSVLYLILFVIIFVVLLKLIKIVWKAILITLILFLLITGLTVYFAYKDVSNIMNKDKLLILVDNQDVLAGGIINSQFEGINYLNNSQISGYTEQYSMKNYSGMLGNNYLMIILKTKSLENLNLNISLSNTTIKSEDLVKLLESKNEKDFYNQAKELNLTYAENTSREVSDIKVSITKDILKNILNKDTAKLINLLKDTQFYPDRLSILIIKQMPLKVILSFVVKETIHGG